MPNGTRIAIVTFGVNDARKGVSPASIEQNLSAIVSNLKSRNVRVVLRGRKAPFPPGYDKGAYFGGYQRLVKQNGIAGCYSTRTFRRRASPAMGTRTRAAEIALGWDGAAQKCLTAFRI